jgi:2-C-methyl-D-erythritol 2,4-cyclodiphosphate synthase
MGHSDADVLIHSICDALLGAAGMGDIGLHFPSNDERFKDRASTDFLQAVAGLLRENRRKIENIDCVIIAQEPKLNSFFGRMKKAIADAAGIEVDDVNIKGKSPEGMGSLGRGEAVAAFSVALLSEVPRRPASPSRGPVRARRRQK